MLANKNQDNGLSGQQINKVEVNHLAAGSSDVSITKSPAWIVKNSVTFMHLFARDKLKMKKSGKSLVCRCPFHHDSTPSFSVYNEGKSAKCFGCGWNGDIFDYEQQAHKINFSEALVRLEHLAHRLPKYPGEWLPPQGESQTIYIPSTEEIRVQTEASMRLAEDDEACNYIAQSRGWQESTIQFLAEEGSLGWQGESLVFNYATGMKLRAWPDRKFWWQFGCPGLWRSNQIRKEGGIILCEGETDAITLVDIGMDDDYSIVALPSATSIPFGLAAMLEGRDVLLCMDNDEAGERAVARLIPLLRPSCSSLSTFVYGEVQP